MAKRAETLIREFFEDYAVGALKGDAKIIAAAYFNPYIEAAPGAVTAHAIDTGYRKALAEKTAAMRDQLGMSSVELDLERIEEFAPDHFLAKAQWTMRFTRPDRDPVTTSFAITYIVRHEKQSLTILLYVSHEDEETVLKRDGVI